MKNTTVLCLLLTCGFHLPSYAMEKEDADEGRLGSAHKRSANKEPEKRGRMDAEDLDEGFTAFQSLLEEEPNDDAKRLKGDPEPLQLGLLEAEESEGEGMGSMILGQMRKSNNGKGANQLSSPAGSPLGSDQFEESNPGHTHYNLGVDYTEKGQHDDAIKEYLAALSLPECQGQERVQTLHRLGFSYAKKGRYNDAIREYLAVLEIPEFQGRERARSHHNLGFSYAKNGQYGDSIRECLAALAIPLYQGKERGLTYHILGLSYAKKGQYGDAIRECLAALAIPLYQGNERGQTYHVLGLSYAKKGQYDDAIREYLAALNILLYQGKERVKTLVNLGVLYNVKRQTDDSIKTYVAALGIPECNGVIRGRTYLNLGLSYGKKGQYDASIREYLSALQIPEFQGVGRAKAHHQLGTSYANKGQYDDAIREYFAALTILEYQGQERALTHRVLAKVYNTKGQHDDAAKHEKAAVVIEKSLGNEGAPLPASKPPAPVAVKASQKRTDRKDNPLAASTSAQTSVKLSDKIVTTSRPQAASKVSGVETVSQATAPVMTGTPSLKTSSNFHQELRGEADEIGRLQTSFTQRLVGVIAEKDQEIERLKRENEALKAQVNNNKSANAGIAEGG